MPWKHHIQLFLSNPLHLIDSVQPVGNWILPGMDPPSDHSYLNLSLSLYHNWTSPLIWNESESFSEEASLDYTNAGNGEVTSESKLFLWTWPIILPIVLLGAVGNLVILYAILVIKKFRMPVNFLLANLSLASLLTVGSFISAGVLQKFPLITYGPWTCRLLPTVLGVMTPVEGFTMVGISLQRMRQVQAPLEKHTTEMAKIGIVIIWIASIFLYLPLGLLFWDFDEARRGSLKCFDRKELLGSHIPYVLYQVLFHSIMYYLPSLVLMKDVCSLYSKLRYLLTAVTDSEFHKIQRELVRNALIFTGLFIFIKIPLGTYFFLCFLPPKLMRLELYDWIRGLRPVFYSVWILHSSIYPFIIFCLSLEIREHFNCPGCCVQSSPSTCKERKGFREVDSL